MENQAAANDPLDIIGAQAGEFEAAPTMPGAVIEAVPNPASEWAEAARFGGGMITALLPELAADWESRYDKLGEALAKCAAHYGWDVGEVISHPLVGLAIVSFPMAAGAVRAVKARKEAAKRRPPAAATAAPSVPDVGAPVMANTPDLG